jgi:hypothetical protein
MLTHANEVIRRPSNRGCTNNLPLDTIIEDLMLLRRHRKHAIERKAILLWAIRKSSRFHLDSLEVIIESDNNISAFPQFQ